MTATRSPSSATQDHGGGAEAATPAGPARRGRRERTPSAPRRRGRVRRTALLVLVVALGAVGLTACYPQEAVTAVYSVNVNGSIGEITVRQSGGGATAVYTATVTAPFKLSGFSCALTPGTVVASFTGAGPTFTEQYAKFNISTCVKAGDGNTVGAVATLNDDDSLTLGLASSGSSAQAALLTRTGNASWSVSPVSPGNYAVNVNGSIGALAVHQSGSGATATYTATVTASFKLSGFTCSLAPGTVVASFTGAGPTFTERYAKFSTDCTKASDGNTVGALALLNGDNTLTLGLANYTSAAQAALLTRTGDLTTVATPVPTGQYAVNVNGSIGALAVHQSGSDATATYTVTVTAPFKLSGLTCSLAPGTVVASFTGAGPTFTERYAKFGTNCVKASDGNTVGAVALLNSDNTLTLGLANYTSAAQTALLTRTGDLTTVASPVAQGTYSVNVNGSVGAIQVVKSGSGASTTYTATVAAPFALSGFSCSLTQGTVIATFTGEGPTFTERYAKFNTNCTKASDGNTVGAVALLNSDNTLTLGLANYTSAAQTSLLHGRT